MPPTSSSNFQLIVDAFNDYAEQVGLDLSKNPHAEALRACDSPNAVFELLQDKAHSFKDYRDGDRKLVSWLKPVVEVVHGFSSVLGQAISLVSQIHPTLPVTISTRRQLGALSSSECDICQCGCSPNSEYPVAFPASSSDI